MKTLSIVIPVYNEERFIEKTIQAVQSAPALHLEKEIIIVDDGSTDATASLLEKYKTYAGMRVLIHPANRGKGAALKTGFLASSGDIVVVKDADLEYSPDDLPVLLEPFLKQGADVVYGSRFISDRPHRVLYFWHAVANKLLTLCSNMLTNLTLTDMETGYKAFRGEIIRALAPKLQSERFGFEPEITARLSKIKGIRFYEVGISYEGRTYEEGKKITWRDGLAALWYILRFTLG